MSLFLVDIITELDYNSMLVIYYNSTISDQQNLDMQYNDLVSKIDNFLNFCISKALKREALVQNIFLLGPNIGENEEDLRLQAKNPKIDEEGDIKMQLCLYSMNSNIDYNSLFRQVIIPAINKYIKSNQDYEVKVTFKPDPSKKTATRYQPADIFTSESVVVLTFKQKDLDSGKAEEFEA